MQSIGILSTASIASTVVLVLVARYVAKVYLEVTNTVVVFFSHYSSMPLRGRRVGCRYLTQIFVRLSLGITNKIVVVFGFPNPNRSTSRVGQRLKALSRFSPLRDAYHCTQGFGGPLRALIVLERALEQRV